MTKTKRATQKRNHNSIVEQFQSDVLSGVFPCGSLFKAAVQRHTKDLTRQNTPDFPYYYDSDKAAKACRFAELLPYAEGPKRGQRFVLEPWQCWLLSMLFGWFDSQGFRRFRMASLWLPKGNGKSPIAAIIATIILATDNTGPKCYSAASMTKQARIVFRYAQDMLRLAPDICSKFRLGVEEHRIRGQGDNRVYEPISAEAGSIEGVRPSLAILDEVHVLPNRKLFDNLKSATTKVDGSLFLLISTAGFDCSPESIGWQQYTRAKDILDGRASEPATLALIACADPTDDPWSEATWRKANPNYGVSVSITGIREAAKTAIEVPSEQPSFLTKHLNLWQQSASKWLNPLDWRKCGNLNLNLNDFKGKAYIGLDLAQTGDLTALAIVFVSEVAQKRHYSLFTRFWLPEESITLTQTPALKQWATQGFLTLTSGAVLDPREIRDTIQALCRNHPGSEVCYDPWSATQLAIELQEQGIVAIETRQGSKTQSEPMKAIEAAILDGTIIHDSNQVMEYCLSNAVAESDTNGNLKLTRESKHDKIDGVSALVNAMSRAIHHIEQQQGPMVFFLEY